MTPEQKHLVQTSFEQVKPIADTAAALFYGRLFDLDPGLERLFKGDLEEQGRQLMHMIGLAVKGLNRPHELAPLLHALGQRHTGYGVSERDYETVGAALLWTLEQGLGDAFTPEVSDAWAAVYELLAGAMKAGAREALLVTTAPTRNTAATCTGGDRKGWRGYFPAAAHKTSKKRETEMETENNYQKLTGRFMTTLATVALTLFLFAVTAQATTYTVTTTIDNGLDANPTAGSLRKAIIDSNANVGANTINFNIPGAGLHTITPPAPLPKITWAVTIDGYSQRPCAANPQPCSSPNTQADGSNASLLIELNGTNAGANANGFTIDAANCVIDGLIINRFSGDGIYIEKYGAFVKGENALIYGCFIGTNAAGNAAAPNLDGVYISQSPNNIVGGIFLGQRNLISGNTGVGVHLTDFGTSTAGNIIAGNLIGTDKSGTGAIANEYGISLNHVGGANQIGGGGNARNVISGNLNAGVVVLESDFTLVIGNYIGTNATGTGKVGNNNGIAFQGSSSNNKIGNIGTGNLISGNVLDGIVFLIGTPFTNEIVGNLIGTKADGVSALGNGGSGVNLTNGAINNQIGGTAPGSGNVIAFNYAGITSTASTGNAIEQNSIFSNTHLGIDFVGNNNLVPNDSNDPDGGPNNLQNFPVITSALNSSGITTISGSLNSEDNKSYRIEFFANSQCNASGNGDGQIYLGSTTVTTSSNNASFGNSFPGFNLNQFVTATATDPNGNTSEFSKCKQVTAPPLPVGNLSFSASNYSVSEGGGSATVTVSRTGGSAGAISVHYATSNGTATAGSDYTAASGTLNWADSDAANKTFTIPITNDNLDEPDETVNVALSNPTGGASLGNPNAATLTITDDDSPVVVSIIGLSHAEGDSGTTNFVFNVLLSENSGQTVTVNYATVAGGTATLGSDYQSASGTLTFAPGEGGKTVTVLVNGDTQDEPDETFFVQLSNPTNATLGIIQATGTIVNDDAVPTPTPTPVPTATPTPVPTATPTPVPTPTSTPSVSISDVSLAEGSSGSTSFDFEVLLSAPSSQTVTVDFATSDGSATSGSDYQPSSGTLIFNPGETSKTIAVMVNGDTTDEPNENFSVSLSNPANATIGKAQGTGTIMNDDAPGGPTFDFSQANYSVAEQLGAVTVTVVRNGDSSAAASVDYATADGSAVQKSDFEITAGTLNFAPGESSKTVSVLINQDSYTEGPESFNLVLSNPSGAALGQSSTQVNIIDDLPESLTNPIDDPQSFVYMHYHDFLNREPDQAGLQFWTDQINSCSSDQQCIEAKRINVSAAYFLSVEFQQTGYLLHLMQKESFGSLPRYSAFMRDLQEVGRGVVVNSPGWEQKLADNQQQFAEKWVNRPGFKAAYDGMSNLEFVNSLYANAGVLSPQAERDALVTALDTTNQSRAAALLDVAANAAFRQQEQNSAFVLMQYFGYLRRDPDSGPDSDLSGYYFWLAKLNAFNGDYQKAEMVKSFLVSSEYRSRFGQQ